MPKKYLILTVFLFTLLGAFFLYLSIFNKNNKTASKQEWPDFLKGIVYSPYYPGETGGDILPDDGRYSAHLQEIKSLGANTLSIFPEKMPAGFFTALDEADLLYVPIININLYDGTSNEDLLSKDYQSKVISHIKEIIDYNYSTGRPEHLAYFVLGYEINPQYINLTNNLHPQEKSYSGEFISLLNRQPAEIALAKLLDAAMSYEMEVYGKRHSYAHNSFPAYGFLSQKVNLYELNPKAFFPDFFDIIAINLYPSYFYPDEGLFIAYLDALANLSDKPVIISEFGSSTAPGERVGGVPAYEDGSEKAAAKLFSLSARHIVGNKKIKGLFFFEFMDEHWKNGEELADASFHNPDDAEEWFGLYQISVLNNVFSWQEKKEMKDVVKKIFNSENSDNIYQD